MLHPFSGPQAWERRLFFIFLLIVINILGTLVGGDSITKPPETTRHGPTITDGRPPRIIQHPSDLVVPKNEPATLQCQADGYPPPQISWYKDQGELVSSSASILNPLLNLFGAKATTETDQSRLSQQNGALHFTRVVHNKKDRPDAGVYWCVAANQYGQAKSRNATLQIAFLRDEFRRQPNASQRVTSGGSALLECHPPRGHPIPRIYWKRDGKELKTTGRFALMDEGNLVISDVRPSDAGQYVCVAENLAAVKESHPVSLYVYSRPSVITPPQDVTALADDNVVFECKVVGDPLPTVTWHKKDSRKVMATDSRFQTQDDGGLRINRVSVADEGAYFCQADNSMGSVSETAVLTVHSRPIIVMPPRDQRVVVGGAATFDCLTNGNPAPAVFWTKEGSQILMFPGQPHGRFSVQSDGTLIITGVEKLDSGNYVCSALSVAGSAVVKVQLEVTTAAHSPPPIILIGPVNQTLAINAVATLPCSSIGTPPPSITWLKDDVWIPLDEFPRANLSPSGTLQISDLRITDSGVFTCVASSESGRTTWSSGLVVESPTNPHVTFHRMPDLAAFPGAPSKPVLANVTETAIEISWRPSANTETDSASTSVRLYRVEYFCFEDPKGWVMGSHPTVHNRFTISGLKPDFSYVFLVRAVTPGQGITSPPSPLSDKIMTLSVGRPTPDIDINQVRSLFAQAMVELSHVEAISPTAISLHWQIIQNEKYISGYYVKCRKHGLPDSNYSILSFRKGSSLTFTVFSLKKFTKYEFRLVPYHKEVIGRESNMLMTRTLSDVPDEAPQDVRVNLVDLTTLSISWHPPSFNHLNGQLAGYRVSVIPTGVGTLLGGRNISLTPAQIRNVSAGYSDAGSEVIGNLTAGMRYRVTVAAKTDAGLGISSRPLYIRMENNVAGMSELLQQPWFIGVLSGVLALLLLAISIILLLQRKRKFLLSKAAHFQARPPPCPSANILQFHPYIRPSESGSLLPNSIVGLPFVPASSGIGTAHQHPGATHWMHCSGEWAKQACQMNNNNLLACGREQRDAGSHPCPVHGRYLYGPMNSGSNMVAPVKPYSEATDRLAKLETGESSLSSHGHSYQETVSVHSRRSSADDREQKILSGHPLNWADLLPPPPRGPPSPSISGDRRHSSSKYRENSLGSASDLENDLLKRMADLRRKYEIELRYMDNASLRRPQPIYNNRPLKTGDGARNRRVLQQASLDRPLRGPARLESSQILNSRQYFAHRLVHNLARTRSCESSINNDDERESDISSDNETADVQFIDDGNNGETSPCLSSEASFFLEKGLSAQASNFPLDSNNAPNNGARDISAASCGRDRQAAHQSHRIYPNEKFRKPLPFQKDAPRPRRNLGRHFQDTSNVLWDDLPQEVARNLNRNQGIMTLPLKYPNSKIKNPLPVRRAEPRPKKRFPVKEYGQVAVSEPPQSIC